MWPSNSVRCPERANGVGFVVQRRVPRGPSKVKGFTLSTFASLMCVFTDSYVTHMNDIISELSPI